MLNLKKISTIFVCLTFAANTAFGTRSEDNGIVVNEFAKAIPQVDALTIDNKGHLYATSETLVGAVYRISPEGIHQRVTQWIPSADGLTHDAEGSLYVSSEWLFGKVLKLTPSGDRSTVVRNLHNPEGLKFDSQGRLYIVEDREKGRVLRFEDGELTVWVDGLNRPENIAFNDSENLYVTESGANRIIEIMPSGKRRTLPLELEIREPDGITYSSIYKGFFVTEDKHDGRLLYINRKGKVISLASNLNKPQGVVCDSEGGLYVSEQDKNRILRVSAEDLRRIILRN